MIQIIQGNFMFFIAKNLHILILLIRRNWSPAKQAFVAFLISLMTFTMYIGSAIYTPSIPGIMEEFNVSLPHATLGLTLYVLGKAHKICHDPFKVTYHLHRVRNWPHVSFTSSRTSHIRSEFNLYGVSFPIYNFSNPYLHRDQHSNDPRLPLRHWVLR